MLLPGGPLYTGSQRERILGFGWREAIHPDEIEEARSAFTRGFAEGKPFHREQRMRRADGVDRRFLIQHTPYCEEDGVIAHWYGTGTDIEDPRAAASGRPTD